MMYNEVKSGDIQCLRFLKGTDYVMYLGPELTWLQKRKLNSPGIRVQVIYLPDILAQLSKSVVNYNFPGVNIPEALSTESIYAQIRGEFGEKISEKNRYIIRYEGDILMVYDAKEDFSLMLSYLINKCYPSRFYTSEPLHFREIDPEPDLPLGNDFMGCCDEEPIECSRSDVRFRVSRSDDYVLPYEYHSFNKNVRFDSEMGKALAEVERSIKDLMLKGCPPEMILSFVNQSVKISRLRITKQYKIILPDYDDMEIKMGPLPKAVFLFFLLHPEGVAFSQLFYFRNELRKIYSRVCKSDDPATIRESIDRLTDPFDNSICEKCATIKKAFMLKISDTFAQNYYIKGIQGERKSISLDRNMVEWECGPLL
ncbi:MAG: hypothetical protein II318_03805 [Bacteroidales bacterium]|nr:hypothetical protein [Bacteroidales bacterium]